MKKFNFIFLFFSFFIFQPLHAAAFPYLEATISDTESMLKTKKLTCETLVNAYLTRIKAVNLSMNAEHAPLNAVAEINTSVLNEAQKLDQYYAKTGQLKGALHCVPVLIKDNVGTFDQTTTVGSFAMLGNQAVSDATIVQALRKAGAIILGHTTMDEFAFSMQGISSRNGRTGNAYDTNQNPGGSSSGSAAAVSANLAVVAIGTDNSGSVRVPAAFNGIYGLRPTPGLISQHGIFPMGNLDGVAGPMARTVTDLALLLDVIAIADSHDAKTKNVSRIKTYTAFLQPDGLRGKRIGVVRLIGKIDPYHGMSSENRKVFRQALNRMKTLGAVVVEEVKLPDFNADREFNMSGMIDEVNAYLASYPATRKNFTDICQSERTKTFGNVSHCLKFMDETPKLISSNYQQVLQMLAANRKYVHAVMQKLQLDALYIPISRTGGATYDVMQVNTWQAPVSSNAGLPSMAINVGYTAQGLPIGAEFVGKAFDEGNLIAIAYAYEQHTPPRKVPALLSTTDEQNYSIAEYNNLLTLIGVRAYQNILRYQPSSEDANVALTPRKFSTIVASTLHTN